MRACDCQIFSTFHLEAAGLSGQCVHGISIWSKSQYVGRGRRDPLFMSSGSKVEATGTGQLPQLQLFHLIETVK